MGLERPIELVRKLKGAKVGALTGHKTLQMLNRYFHMKDEDLAEFLK